MMNEPPTRHEPDGPEPWEMTVLDDEQRRVREMCNCPKCEAELAMGVGEFLPDTTHLNTDDFVRAWFRRQFGIDVDVEMINGIPWVSLPQGWSKNHPALAPLAEDPRFEIKEDPDELGYWAEPISSGFGGDMVVQGHHHEPQVFDHQIPPTNHCPGCERLLAAVMEDIEPRDSKLDWSVHVDFVLNPKRWKLAYERDTETFELDVKFGPFTFTVFGPIR